LISVPVLEGSAVRMMIGVGNKPNDYEDPDVEAVQLIGNDLWRIAQRNRTERQLQLQLVELGALNSKLAETQSQLMQSEKLSAIGQLAAGIAHEINNPVGFVYSNLTTLSEYVDELLAIDGAYDEIEDHLQSVAPQLLDRVRALKATCDHPFIVSDLRHLLRESREGLERVKTIVQDLKDFSRTGDTGWDWADLQKGLESTLNIVRNEIKYKADIVREWVPLPAVRCIPAQINQVFMNLLVNAAQAIEDHGTIVLRSGVDRDSVWIAVQDNGCGIAPDKISRIFDPFYTSKPVGQGTGLGLTLVWSIVQRHQGSIDVQSTPGQGTCFTLRLPVNGPASDGPSLP
jgi:signal transduction histidine kinase